MLIHVSSDLILSLILSMGRILKNKLSFVIVWNGSYRSFLISYHRESVMPASTPVLTPAVFEERRVE
jgi:hypothetical protein